MTVASTTARKSFTGDAVTTSFATSPLVFFDDADLDVYVVVTATGVSETLVLDTDYTVSGGDGSTGTVNLAGGSSPYGAPAATQTVVIVRDVALTQSSDFINNDTSDAEVVEDAFDRLTMIAQQLRADIDRTLILADSDVTGVSVTLPTPAASELLGWNAGATAMTSYPAASIAASIIPTSFAETLLDDATAAEARTTLDAQQDVFTTRGDLVRAGASGVAERVALGAAGAMLASDGTDAVWQAMATQAQQETGTSVIAPVTPGRQQFHPSAAKVWVVFGWVANVPTVIGSYNLTSLTDEGVGDVTFVFATDFSGATYSWALGGSTVTTDIRWAWNSGAAPAAGSFRASYTNTSQANVDGTWASAVFYGDQ